MFRTETQHAFRALAVLAQEQGKVVVADLAERSQVPAPMLGKVLHRLSQHGFVRGQPGPGGGYRLARAADEVRLIEVVSLIEGPRFGTSCLFGLPHCSDAEPCPLHPVWGEIRRQILAVLSEHTLADLANRKVTMAVVTGANFPGDRRTDAAESR